MLAIGGDLSLERLLNAYRLGIFPWYDKGPILWWSPDPRAVIFLDSLHISRSLQKTLRKTPFTIKTDEQFANVMTACAGPRHHHDKPDAGTWLNKNMQAAYLRLHQQGYAHSIEVYEDEQLVGGIYGVALGSVFFGESMFSLRPNASKIAMVHLVNKLISWDFTLIDCQVASSHLMRMGAALMPRAAFLKHLNTHIKLEDKISNWQNNRLAP